MTLQHVLHFPKLQTLIFFSLSFFLIIGSITVFSVAATYLAIKPLDFTAPDSLPIVAQVRFKTELLSVDATARTMEMDWYPDIGLGCNPDPSFVADIYFDPGFLDSTSPSFTSLPPRTPAYQVNASALCSDASPTTLPVFRTVAKLLRTDDNMVGNKQRSSLQEYPFDVYMARIAMYALDHNTGAFITINVTHSYGIAVNFEVTPQITTVLGGQHQSLVPTLLINLWVMRSRAAKMFVVLVVVSNWLVTAAFLVISAAAVVYPNHRYYSEMFVLPVGVLFAFTSIRANLPGAPVGFGARIDLFSILPVLVIVTLCSFFLLLSVLYNRLIEGERVKVTHVTALPSPKLQQREIQEENQATKGSPHDVVISMEPPCGGSASNVSADGDTRSGHDTVLTQGQPTKSDVSMIPPVPLVTFPSEPPHRSRRRSTCF